MLESLKHGTSASSYVSISITGGNPSLGGKDQGESGAKNIEGIKSNSRNYFFVLTDPDFSLCPNILRGNVESQIYFIPLFVAGRFIQFAAFAKLKKLNASLPQPCRFSVQTLELISSLFWAVVPALKFRYRSDELCETYNNQNLVWNYADANLLSDKIRPFIPDPGMIVKAFKTPQYVPPYRAGITGSILYGLNASLMGRMASDPEAVLMGMCLMSYAVKLTLDLLGKKQGSNHANKATNALVLSFMALQVSKRVSKGLSHIEFYGSARDQIFINFLFYSCMIFVSLLVFKAAYLTLDRMYSYTLGSSDEAQSQLAKSTKNTFTKDLQNTFFSLAHWFCFFAIMLMYFIS